MRAQAWPYAVARGRLTGFQAIVVPDFLADAGEAYLLEYASGAEVGAGSAELVVRAVRGSATGPVTIAYRVANATADRYGLEGDTPLRDRAGRDIRVFEGLALRLPARSVAAAEITAADMDGVSARISPAFRRLWEAADPIEADRSASVSLGSGRPDSPVLGTYLSGPGPRLQRRGLLVGAIVIVALVVAGISFALGGTPGSQAAPHHTAKHVPVKRQTQTARPRPRPRQGPSPVAG